jgi:hypothetical protein
MISIMALKWPKYVTIMSFNVKCQSSNFKFTLLDSLLERYANPYPLKAVQVEIPEKFLLSNRVNVK